MKTLAKRLVIAAAVASLSVGAAHAHRAWFVPSSTVISGDNAWVTIDGAVSNNLFFPDHRPMQTASINVTGPDGKPVQIANASVGQYRTTFDIKLEQKGTYRIAQANGGFNASYKEGTETKRWRGTLAEYAAQGIDKKPGVELTATNRRVETFVTNGAPTEIKATNKGLELVAGPTHPNDLYSGEEATFKMLDNGKPAANVEVVVILGGDRYREEAGELKLKTGADGVLKVKFDKPGMYWLEAESKGTTTMEGKQLKSQSTYVAVLEVLPS
ncbi:MAG: DUF4198 domain-containing protein [Alphaproteobacteria bacterium]|jgi:uncharacterized GH25 family protein|nr:MAG: DUF4198 domain-containing protein [Alphaproteobacteria bacterium]